MHFTSTLLLTLCVQCGLAIKHVAAASKSEVSKEIEGLTASMSQVSTGPLTKPIRRVIDMSRPGGANKKVTFKRIDDDGQVISSSSADSKDSIDEYLEELDRDYAEQREEDREKEQKCFDVPSPKSKVIRDIPSAAKHINTLNTSKKVLGSKALFRSKVGADYLSNSERV